MPIGVIIESRGFLITFVASNLPPKPVSSNRKSESVVEYFKNAAAVINSNIVIGAPLLTRSHSNKISSNTPSSI